MDRIEKNTRLDQYPDYQAATRRLVELQLEFSATERAITNVRAEIRGIQSTGRPKNEIDALAEARIVGAAPQPLASVRRVSLEGELERLGGERKVLARAVELQRAQIDRLRTELSAKIHEHVAPKHQALVRAVVKAAVALAEASAAEEEFRKDLYEGGVTVGATRPMAFPRLGALTEAESTISRYLLEAFEFGFIDRGELPPALVKAIPPASKRKAA